MKPIGFKNKLYNNIRLRLSDLQRLCLTQSLRALTFEYFTAKACMHKSWAPEDGLQRSKTPTRRVIWQRICSLWANKRKKVWEMKANDFEDLKEGGTSLITNTSPPHATVGLSSSSSASCFLPHPSLNSSPLCSREGERISQGVCTSALIRVSAWVFLCVSRRHARVC